MAIAERNAAHQKCAEQFDTTYAKRLRENPILMDGPPKAHARQPFGFFPRAFACLFLTVITGLFTACSTTSHRSQDAGGFSLVANDDISISSGNAEKFLVASKRIHEIAHRLRVGSRELCSASTSYATGFSYLNAAMLRRVGLQRYETSIDAGDRVSIVHVAQGSAADRAGIRQGDIIERVSGYYVSENGGEETFPEGDLASAVQSGNRVSLQLRRGQERISVSVQPEKICDFTVGLSDIRHSWIYWSNGQVLVTVAAANEPDEDDNTLALYIAHHAAHGLMRHQEKIDDALGITIVADLPFFIATTGLVIASMGGLPKPILPFSQATHSKMRGEFEPKADLLSVHMLAASGYSPEIAVSRLRKAANPYGYFYKLHVFGSFGESFDTTTKNRIDRMEKEIAKINEKQKRGIPLVSDVPELEAIFREIADNRVP